MLDGSGTPAFAGEIGIRADTIAFIAAPGVVRARAKRVLDAGGAVVAPGFIDPHTHTLDDLSDPLRRANLPFLFQGVTTVVAGNDGGSVVHIGRKLAEWDSAGIGTNAALYVGHRTLRRLVMGMDQRVPTEEELENMKTMVRRGMEEGALGLSAGLYYAPASFARTEEVIALARVAAAYGGVYDVHLRDESSYNIGLAGSVAETIRIAREAGLPAHIAHIKCLGIDVWGQSDTIIAMIEAARREGLDITADQYPYRASGTNLASAILPPQAFADATNYTDNLNDPGLLPGIREGMSDNLRRRGGAESLLIIHAELPGITGRNLAEIAAEWRQDPIDAALRILHNGNAAVASFNMQEDDIRQFMRQPWVMTGSDGSNAHPRKYGSFPLKLREYVLDKKVISLPEFIRRSSWLTAQTLGIERRGRLAPGTYADIIVFDPEKVRDRATFTEPDQLAEGMSFVIVNGKIVIEKEQHTGVLAGSALRRTPVRP